MLLIDLDNLRRTAIVESSTIEEFFYQAPDDRIPTELMSATEQAMAKTPASGSKDPPSKTGPMSL
jgi:hypothetical protein